MVKEQLLFLLKLDGYGILCYLLAAACSIIYYKFKGEIKYVRYVEFVGLIICPLSLIALILFILFCV